MKHGSEEKSAKPVDTGLAQSEITQEIIGAAFAVHDELGYGFLERVYQKALQVELQWRGLKAVTEAKVQVKYKGVVVGDYSADLLVADCVVVELKVAAEYNPLDEAQLLNELKASGIKVGLLLNFGRSKVQLKRMVM
jgi:GxxExxY protein